MITARSSSLPPLYTHVIGSLPRPQLVRELVERRHEMSQERFTGLIQEMIVFAIRLQEQAGIDVVSDGEWSRLSYINAFLDPVRGCEKLEEYFLALALTKIETDTSLIPVKCLKEM